MSKHLPNCPHLSEYDGLGDAGILMALNKKWGDRTPDNDYQQQINYDTDKKLDQLIEKTNRMLDEFDKVIKLKPKDYEERLKTAYINGYNQCKKDSKKGIDRSAKIAWREYWGC